MTLRELGEQGLGYRLVRSHDCTVPLEEIARRRRLPPPDPRRLTLRFHTPTTLRREGRLFEAAYEGGLGPLMLSKAEATSR